MAQRGADTIFGVSNKKNRHKFNKGDGYLPAVYGVEKGKNDITSRCGPPRALKMSNGEVSLRKRKVTTMEA